MKTKKLQITPFFQKKNWSCGPVSIKIILDYFGIVQSEKTLIKLCKATERWGTNPIMLAKVIKKFGLKTKHNEWGGHRTLDYWINRKKLPVIVDWFRNDEGHYSVACRINKNFIWFADPAIGKIKKMEWQRFKRVWFDFEGDYIKRKKSLYVRWWMVAYK